MPDKSGQAEIRGIQVDKLAKGFADEEYIFKKFVINNPTAAREIRWYRRTAGALTGVTTTGMTSELIENSDQLALPTVIEQSFTRNTSYVRTYIAESPVLSDQDIADSDPDIIGGNVRDIVRAIAKRVDARIYDVVSDTQATGSATVNSGAATGTGWDDTTNGNPVLDILKGKQNIRGEGYNPEGAILAMNSIEHKFLLNYLITVKGSSIPQFSSQIIKPGVVMELLGCNIVVSQNAVTDSVTMWVPDRAATWKQFTPLQSVIIDEPLIGKKIRVKEEGECILTDPKAVYVITDTIT